LKKAPTREYYLQPGVLPGAGAKQGPCRVDIRAIWIPIGGLGEVGPELHDIK